MPDPWSLATVVQIGISKGGVPKHAGDEGHVTSRGMAGDAWRHPNIHGGQAILLITAEGIAELVSQGFPVYMGALGENVTSRGLDRRSLRAGQRYSLGNDVVIELTKRRAPCDTLSVYGAGIQKAIYDAQVQAGDPSSPRSGLSGFYASVVGEGLMRVGDTISLVDECD